jgi:hypothetical protein
MAQYQTEPLPPDNSGLGQSPPKRGHANPSKEPSMPASFTGTKAESENQSFGNPRPIHGARKTL